MVRAISVLATAFGLGASTALAQTVQARPLPPLPPASAPPASAPPPASPLAPAETSSPPAPAAAVSYAPRPPVFTYEAPPAPLHAPRFSLYLGGRLGFVGFIGNFYENENRQLESTSQLVGRGAGLELDAGARLGKRFIPYVFLEHGFLDKGTRFDGSDARSSSDLRGIGLRVLTGDVDRASFLWDISIGQRSVTIKRGDQAYTMHGFEYFRIGLGAEIRVSSLFAVSPVVSLSTGQMSGSEGSISYSSSGAADGLQGPRYQNGRSIASGQTYGVLWLGCGAHFDLFGK